MFFREEFSSALFIMFVLGVSLNINPIYASGGDIPIIARWYGDKKAAVSLRFDDSLESHVKDVIPLLNTYGIKATFMVNPGKERYVKYKNFWEKTVPASGHNLGNHTMHHHGAKNLAEAEYEIGETSRTIWKLYPDQSKLQVFASGGGYKRWGGEHWSNASPEYKSILRKYDLIDLYDGAHHGYSVGSKVTLEDLGTLVNKAVTEGKHQAFIFHKVGSPGIKDLIKKIGFGCDLTVNSEQFASFVRYLDTIKAQIWMAPLVSILKYETEIANAKLETVTKNNKLHKIKLSINTDADLYDQNITLAIPMIDKIKINKIIQNEIIVTEIDESDNMIIINVKPINSYVTIYYNN